MFFCNAQYKYIRNSSPDSFMTLSASAPKRSFQSSSLMNIAISLFVCPKPSKMTHSISYPTLSEYILIYIILFLRSHFFDIVENITVSSPITAAPLMNLNFKVKCLGKHLTCQNFLFDSLRHDPSFPKRQSM